MMRERDLLVKEVFPELRSKCAQRFVTFTEVDLRWGITEAQANEGQVLPLCLAEIERSRPYFIGLLGERYGWIPDTIRPEVIAREPWLQEHVQGRTSVTELEILHGVLNNPQMQSLAYFYFRDPAYVNSIPEKDRKNFTAENAKDAEKLRKLKETIRRSRFPVRDGYRNPKVLSRAIRRDLSRLIDRLYPEDQVPDPLVQERMAHEAHARNKLFACIDRPAHLAALNAFAEPAEHSGKGLVVTGESGGGKTALLAAWARDWAKNHPEDFLFQHYFGATPDSASPEGFLRRLLGELRSRFGITDDIPTDPEKLRDALPVWLAQTVGKAHIMLVLDGLNQVQGSEPDRHLLFLPRHFPPHVVVLASALPGRALDALRERGWAEHDLPHASEAEVDAMVGEYLNIHARSLEPELRHQLVTAPGAKNPLFLRTVLEELRQFGSFERLPQRVRHYLEAENPQDLFLRVLTRWQEDSDGKDPDQDKPKLDLVRRALTYLWAARQGISEPEWLDLLGDGSQPLPRALWTPFFLALEPHLSQRAGLFAFGHDFLRQAVEAAFVSSGDLQQAAHLSVADYFERHEHQHEMTPRKVAEWPWQLRQARESDRLRACLLGIEGFAAMHERDPQELLGFWLWLKDEKQLGSLYLKAFEDWSTRQGANAGSERCAKVANQLGLFLDYCGHFQDAERLYLRVLEMVGHTPAAHDPNVAVILNNLAMLCRSTNRLDDAERLLHRVLEINDFCFGPRHPVVSRTLSNLMAVLLAADRLVDAEPIARRALEIAEQSLGSRHPDVATRLNNLAVLLKTAGRYPEAESLARRAVEIRETTVGPDHPATATCLTTLALVLRATNRLAEAEPLLQRALRIDEDCFGMEHPAVATDLNNVAGLFQGRNRLKEAEPLYRRALAIRQSFLGDNHPLVAESLSNLGQLLRTTNGLPEAELLHRRALEILESNLGPAHRQVADNLNNLAELLQKRGQFKEAEPLFRRALEIRATSLGETHPKVAESFNNLANLLHAAGRCVEAVPLYRQALSTYEASLGPNHSEVAVVLSNLAAALRATQQMEEVESLYRRSLAISTGSFGQEHPKVATCLNNLAFFLKTTRRYAEAEPLFRQALTIRQKSFGPGHPEVATVLNNLAMLLAETQRLQEGESLLRLALDISERSQGPHHPTVAVRLGNLAALLRVANRLTEAEPLMRRSVDILLRHSVENGREHPQLRGTIQNYRGDLIRTGRPAAEVAAILAALGKAYGFRFDNI